MENKKVYVIQEHYDYNLHGIHDAFPVAVVTNFDDAKKHIKHYVRDAVAMGSYEGYSKSKLSTSKIENTDALYEIGIFEDNEGLITRISIYEMNVDEYVRMS